MMPMLALGPSLLMGGGAAKGLLSLGSLSMSPSFLRFGPGLPRAGLGVVAEAASMTAEVRLEPGLGPFLDLDLSAPAAGVASVEGVVVPLMAAGE